MITADISATAAEILSAVFGLVGALVGGGFTILGQQMASRSTRKLTDAANKEQAIATAILIQDDFLHFQATLARGLDRRTWWKPAEMLAAQASIQDRKTVWAALPDADTYTVAAAQGWMDYLVGLRALQGNDATPPLSRDDCGTMVKTFNFLEDGRAALGRFIGRPFVPFDGSGVIAQLKNCFTVQQLLNNCP